MSSFDQKTRLLPLHQSPHSLTSTSTPTTPTTPQPPQEDSVRTKYAWLTVYFALNLALTLYNKAVMGKVGTCDSTCGPRAICMSCR